MEQRLALQDSEGWLLNNWPCVYQLFIRLFIRFQEPNPLGFIQVLWDYKSFRIAFQKYILVQNWFDLSFDKHKQE